MDVRLGKLLVLGTVLAASLSLTSIARADSVNGAVWTNAATYPNNLSTTAPTGPTAATVLITGASGNIFSFFSATDADLTAFLTSGGDTVTYLTGGTGGINDDVMDFWGTTQLVHGQSYSITKDDAVYLTIDGVAFLSGLSDTSADTISAIWTGATGSYSFNMLYQEVNGAPAELESPLISTTPEPGSFLLLGTGLLIVAFAVRRQARGQRIGTLA
jgi:hypothetical protein